MIEPDGDARAAIVRVLRDTGFEVETAGDLDEARACLKSAPQTYELALVTPRLAIDDERRSGLALVQEIVVHSERCLALLMIELGESPYCDDHPVLRKPLDTALLPAQIAAALAERTRVSVEVDAAAIARDVVARLIALAKLKPGSRGIEVVVAALFGLLTREEIADVQGLASQTTRDTIAAVIARIGASGLAEMFRVALELAGADFRALLSEWIERDDVRERMLKRLAELREARETRLRGRGRKGREP